MADADEATTRAIAELLNRDAQEAAWAAGESPPRGREPSSSDDVRSRLPAFPPFFTLP